MDQEKNYELLYLLEDWIKLCALTKEISALKASVA